MTAVPGQLISATDVSSRSPLRWPVSALSRNSVADLVARVEADPIVARAGTSTEPQIGPYRQLDTTIDHTNKTFWCHLRPEGAPSFNHALLRDLAHMQRAIMRLFDDNGPDAELPFRHFVVGSRTPGIFNMGGDLAFMADRVRAGDRDALLAYAHACVEVVYNNTIALDLPIITIGLVQGDALGGGFEAALSCNVIVAEKSAKLGLPEILFNLFPGMGAYSLLSRKLDPARAERMILSGRIYSANELYEMGLVDVVAEDGEGERAVRQYISQNARRHAAHRALCDVRRRINPLTFAELRDVTELWVDTALQLTEADLRKMERLAAAQLRRMETRVNSPAQSVAR
jgi:DSF synthase